MNCKHFSLAIIGEKHDSLEKVRSFAGKAGILFEGDDRSGSFNGKGVRGDYIVRGDNLDIRIYEKPSIMPCGFVKMIMRRAMKGENPPKI
jgi:hypothetical protein